MMPPIGSVWQNTQERRVVFHTYGTHAAYLVQFRVYRLDPTTLEWRACGQANCNGAAWATWLRNASRYQDPRAADTTDRRGDVGNPQPGAQDHPRESGEVERGATVDRARQVVDPRAPRHGGRRGG